MGPAGWTGRCGWSGRTKMGTAGQRWGWPDEDGGGRMKMGTNPDSFGTGPAISPTDLRFTPVRVVLTSLRHTKAGPVTSVGSSPDSFGGLSTTASLLHTGHSRRGELETSTVATGLAMGLAFDAFQPFFETGAATSALTQRGSSKEMDSSYTYFRPQRPYTFFDPACTGRKSVRRAPSTSYPGWCMAHKRRTDT